MAHPPDFLSEAEVDAFLKAFPASVKEPFEMRNRAILEVLYSSGLRVSELARLPLTAVDFDNELLRVVGKGSKTRIVPIGKVALRTLRRYLARRAAAAGGEKSAFPLCVSLQKRPSAEPGMDLECGESRRRPRRHP